MFPLLLTANIKKGKINDIYQYKNCIDQIICSPSSGTKFNLVVAASSIEAEFRRITCTVYNPIYDEEVELFSTTFTTQTYLLEREVDCYINWKDAEITLKLFSRRVNPIFTKSFILKDRQSNVNFANNDYRSFDTEQRTYYFYHGNERYIAEKYTCNRTNGIYEPDAGLCLKLSHFKLTYSLLEPITSFKCKKISLYVDNSLHFFDEIRDDEITGTGCEITLTYDGVNSIVPKFQQPFYVDPLTLHMSKVKHPGYIETKNFYFPINYFESKDSELMLLTFYECGYNRVTISLPFEFTVIRDFYGSCYDSDFCLVSHSGTPDFELGETIVH